LKQIITNIKRLMDDLLKKSAIMKEKETKSRGMRKRHVMEPFSTNNTREKSETDQDQLETEPAGAVDEETIETADESAEGPVKDYLSFVRILNANNLPYCMDSGVLLGLMRDGKLFDHEKDVDLQMWADYEEDLRKALPVFREAGYQVTIWLYKGLIYQYRFLKEGYIPVHLMLFRRYGEWAWCPAGEGIGPPFPRRITRHFYPYFVIARKRLRDKLIATDVSAYPWKFRRSLGTWWVPAEYFDNTFYHEEFETFIPEKWREYLGFRYKDWQFPRRKWNFWRRDGALKRVMPEKRVNLDLYRPKNGKAKLFEVRRAVRQLI